MLQVVYCWTQIDIPLQVLHEQIGECAQRLGEHVRVQFRPSFGVNAGAKGAEMVRLISTHVRIYIWKRREAVMVQSAQYPVGG